MEIKKDSTLGRKAQSGPRWEASEKAEWKQRGKEGNRWRADKKGGVGAGVCVVLC